MKKNVQIQCVRGISILLIIIYHVFCRFSQIYLQSDIEAINWFGDFGSMLFMILSAYFLGKPLKDFSLIAFYKKKLLKLWPVYAISVTITFVVTTLYQLPGRTCGFWDYIVNLFFVNGYIGIPYVEPAHWYLTSLLSFIFVAGLLNKLKVFECPEVFTGWMILSVVFRFIGLDVAYKILGGPYVGISCIGMILYKLLNNQISQKSKSRLVRWYAVLVISLGYTMGTKGWQYILYVVFIVPVITLAVKGKLTFIDKSWLGYLGLISYPLFLVHQNIAFVIELVIMEAIGTYNYLCGVIALIVVIVMGALLFILENIIDKKTMHQ